MLDSGRHYLIKEGATIEKGTYIMDQHRGNNGISYLMFHLDDREGTCFIISDGSTFYRMREGNRVPVSVDPV